MNCIHHLFERQAALTPQAIAVHHGQAQLSFGALNTRANQLARFLIGRGVTPGSLVGICLERSTAMVIGLMAVLKAKGAFVPLDPNYPWGRLNFIISDAGLGNILVDDMGTAALQLHSSKLIQLGAHRHEIEKEDSSNLSGGDESNSPAYVLYTSGSTGMPKGVLGLHRGAVNRFRWMWKEYPFREGEAGAQKTSLNFVDVIWEVFGPLLKGIPIHIIPDDIVRDPYRLVDHLAQAQVTRIVLVPSLLRSLLECHPDLETRIPRCTFWVSSGETLPLQLAQGFRQVMPGSRLLNLYGSTEISADVTCFDIADLRPSHVTVPIGRPIDNCQIYVLDGDLKPVPTGSIGEVFVGGEGLAREYLNNPELTNARFVNHPFAADSSARLFRTGDLGRELEDGNLDYIGRADRQIKIRGFRVALEEVESAIETLPGVRQAAVFPSGGDSYDASLNAYVVPSLEGKISLEDLRGHLRHMLPEYMVPSAFTILEDLPMTPSGKVDRLALAAVKPDRRTSTSLLPPRNELEQQILEIWKEVLQLAEIGTTDNFFDLGGTSLKAVQVYNRLKGLTGDRVSIADLFLLPTVTGIAGCLQGEKKVLDVRQMRARADRARASRNRRLTPKASIQGIS